MKGKSITITVIALILGATLLICGATGNNFADKAISTESDNNKFLDVDKSAWFYDDVQYVCENGLMTGISENEFAPNSATTRGMIVTILWRLEDKPISTGEEFDDVNSNDYYYNAVVWATANKIVSGYNENLFGPDDIATREQLSTIIYRYAAYKNYDMTGGVNLDNYDDREQISDYAVDSIKWAVAHQIISGTSEKTVSPKDNVQRCQVAAILKRFCSNIANIPNLTDNEQKNNNADTDLSDENNSNGDENNISTPSSTEASDKNETSTSPTIVVDTINATPGDEVQVAISVKNNPGILGMTLTLYYDEALCTLEKVENGTAVADILDLTTSKNLNNGARFVWDGIEITGSDIKDGDVLLMTFKVKDDVNSEFCPITVKYFNDDIVDNDLNGIYPTIKNGGITISHK